MVSIVFIIDRSQAVPRVVRTEPPGYEVLATVVGEVVAIPGVYACHPGFQNVSLTVRFVDEAVKQQ